MLAENIIIVVRMRKIVVRDIRLIWQSYKLKQTKGNTLRNIYYVCHIQIVKSLISWTGYPDSEIRPDREIWRKYIIGTSISWNGQ
jgi:hypothetical protein